MAKQIKKEIEVSFNQQEAQVILNLLDVACGSPNVKPGGLETAMQAASISSKILSVFNNKDNQDVENTNDNGAN